MLALTLFCLLALAVASAGAAEPPAPEPPAAALTRLGAAALVRDAWATCARLVKATRVSTGAVPPELWVGALKELNPRRVYLHRVNVVAVLRVEGPTEEGLYICLPISSYIPMHGTDGFEYTRLARDVLAYRRNLSDSSRSTVRRFGLFPPREDAHSGTPDLDAGPENRGLRLKLTVSTARQGGTDVHSVRLDLINVGSQPVPLVGQWPYENLRGDYAEFLKSVVTFLAFPEVQPPGGQTGGAERTSPQPQRDLKPGEILTVTWQAQGPRLKPEDCFNYHNTTPEFPGDGLYSVRAQFTALTASGERILLTSNDQPLPIGGSTRMPKFATARIIAADPARKTCRIGLGSDHGLAPGDVFKISYGLLNSWRLTLTRIEAGWSEGPVEVLQRTDAPNVPAFPQPHWLATLVPKEMPTRTRQPTPGP